MAKYKIKQYVVDAVQLKFPMTIVNGGVTTTGAVTDWLVTDSAGNQSFQTNTEFNSTYELA